MLVEKASGLIDRELEITKLRGSLMARTPRGEPRSVPDPVGDEYDAMIRAHKANQLIKDAIAGKLPFGDALPMASLSDFIQRGARPEPTVSIGGQTYRGVDNGRANVLVRADDPLVSSTELADRRRDVARVAFMADNPLGSAAYALTTLLNAPQQLRDGALVAGGLTDAAMSGGAFRGAPARGRASTSQREARPAGFKWPDVRNSGANGEGQALGLNATITKSMLGTGTRANQRVEPPGWQGHGTKFNEGRGHLQGKQLGGSGYKPEDLFTVTQNPTNSSHMQRFENQVARWVRSGEIIEYFVKPLYGAGTKPPSWILMSAYGSKGSSNARLIKNPAGHPK